MKTQWRVRLVLAACLFLGGVLPARAENRVPAGETAKTQVLIVVGPSKHPPGTHEVAAGGRVIQYLLEHAQGGKPIEAKVVCEWPKDQTVFANLATIVFTGDMFPGETLPEPAKIKAQLASLMERGCGMVCLHFATGLRTQHVPADGDHPLLRWIGGYYASGCPHHKSVAMICTATIAPAEGDNPILRGWKAFTLEDEPYFNNYFGKDGMARNVTPLAYSMLPPQSPKKEVVAWAIQRPDGGRGLGVVMPHFFHNWKNDDLRTLILNGIVWTARLDIPPGGVKATLPDLATFAPSAMEPSPKPVKKTKQAK